MTLNITSISSRNAGEEICICFEARSDDGQCADRESFVISSEQYLSMELCKGECDTDVYDKVSAQAQLHACIKRGTLILGYGACSKNALVSKLVCKGFDRECAREAAQYLESRGFLKGGDDALLTARRLADKLWGRKRIISCLYEKGYSKDDICYALCALEDEGVDYNKNCKALFKKKYGAVPEAREQRQKIISALMRYGYTLEEIKTVIK